MIVGTEVRGLTEVNAHLDRITPEIREDVRSFVAERLIALRDGVRDNITRMFQSQGPLYKGVQAEMEEDASGITGRVFIDAEDVPYAAIQERGGKTRPHEIRPVNALALAFMSPAKMGFSGGPKQNALVFAKVVHHPGSNIPEHPYMRLALARERAPFNNGIHAIVARHVKE